MTLPVFSHLTSSRQMALASQSNATVTVFCVPSRRMIVILCMVIPLDAIVIAVFHLCDFLIIEAQGTGDKVNRIGVLDALAGDVLEDFPVAITFLAHLNAGLGDGGCGGVHDFLQLQVTGYMATVP